MQNTEKLYASLVVLAIVAWLAVLVVTFPAL